MVSVMEKEPALSAFSADDEPKDADFVAGQIKRTGVEVITRNSVEQEALEAARGANIVSLDVRIDTVTYKSIDAAQWLKEQNPFRAIFFFTRVPEAVGEDWPVNFILVKGTRAAGLLNRIPLMILVHDVCLALLNEIVRLLEATDHRAREQLRSGLLTRLRHFYYLLPPIQRSAQTSDSSMAHRYQVFRANLRPYIENVEYLSSEAHYPGLSAVRHLLIDNVTTELGELEKIPGVHVREALKEEINCLKEVQVIEPAVEGSAEAAGRTAGEIGADQNTETAHMYLNVWFPDRPVEEPWLLVGKVARMLVNLGDQREDISLAAAAPISEEAEAELETVEYVDVLIICPDADVVPLRNRIPFPPSKETTAHFDVTPLRKGEISLTVLLLIKNDPIHRTLFYFEARDIEVEGVALPS